MRKVIYSENVKVGEGPHGSNWKLREQGEALFLAFGVDYEQLDMAAGTFSTAIVELEDGTVKNVPVGHIKFISGELGDKAFAPIAGARLKKDSIKIASR